MATIPTSPWTGMKSAMESVPNVARSPILSARTIPIQNAEKRRLNMNTHSSIRFSNGGKRIWWWTDTEKRESAHTAAARNWPQSTGDLQIGNVKHVETISKSHITPKTNRQHIAVAMKRDFRLMTLYAPLWDILWQYFWSFVLSFP